MAMALKWLDPIKYTDVTVRKLAGNGPFTALSFDIYLSQRQIPYKLIALTSEAIDITEQIDKGNLVVMLPDFAAIPYNQLRYQYTNRIYPTFETYIPTTGHWIVVKGYKKVDNELYFETYDPYSKGERYENGEPKGKNRYYNSTYIMSSLNRANGWKYAFVFTKGQVNTNEVLRNQVFMPYFELPLGVVNNIPKLGTYVRVAYGY